MTLPAPRDRVVRPTEGVRVRLLRTLPAWPRKGPLGAPSYRIECGTPGTLLRVANPDLAAVVVLFDGMSKEITVAATALRRLTALEALAEIEVL